ncbi:hypothetical protein LI328DRAFT_129380 [Trichoderma asperelloides]|nr:hypothetical protein LI328DRAFT_129380 [Trichoderma asperelloides]
MVMATIGSPYRLTAYGNHADGIRCDDCSRLLRVFFTSYVTSCVPPAILVQAWRPLRFCPHLRLISRELGRAYQITVQSKGSSCQLACSRFEQLPRMRLTTRDAPFLRSLSPDLPLAIEISITDDTELMDTLNE